MLAPAAITALLNAASVVDEKRAFSSCRAAVAYLKERPEVGELRYGISYGYTRTAPAAGAPRTRYVIRFAIRDPQVMLPSWSWPNASGSEDAMLARFTEHVETHEAGHWHIAHAFAARIPRSVLLPANMTRAQAARYFNTFFDSEIAALRAEQDAYDALTEHGIVQGTVLTCGGLKMTSRP